jgi:hypothetical protein
MSDRLEHFIRGNQDRLSEDAPSEKMWQKINSAINDPEQEKAQPTLFISLRKWAVAASMLGLVALTVFLINQRNRERAETAWQAGPANNLDIIRQIDPAYANEVNQFTRIIEVKQTEIKKIEKNYPELYRQFIGDINKLDSMYAILQKELPVNPNREQLLEAMIENLRLQTEVLNQQLTIIKKINESKTNSNENNAATL